MKSLTSKTFDKILQQDPHSMLGFIQKKVDALKKINQLWQTEISTDLAQHSRVANFREDCLVIELSSAVWATRLHYLVPELTKKLLVYPQLRLLKKIEWYIQPDFYPPIKKRELLLPTLTTASSELLMATANAIQNKLLKCSLTRLSRKI